MKIDLPLIFLHFPRTGGYTLNEVLKRKFKNNEMYGVYVPEKGVIPKIVEENFINLPMFEKQKFKFIYGHFFFGLHSFYEHYSYYTLLRNPLDRVVSMYGIALTSKEHYLYDYIIKNKRSGLCNNQPRNFCIIPEVPVQMQGLADPFHFNNEVNNQHTRCFCSY